MKKIGFPLLALCLLVHLAEAQKECELNAPGNACYLQFVSYTADGNYSLDTKPVVFELLKPGESPMEAYTKDTIKDLPAFFNYKFIYVPNHGTTAAEKLDCISSLVSLVSFGYSRGKENLFFLVNDESINSQDVKAAHLTGVFKTIRLAIPAVKAVGAVAQADITSDFKETVAVPDEDEKEETSVKTAAADEKAPQKTYFGAPKTFDYTLSGIVRDAASGEALPFATVQIKGTTNGIATNTDGYFTLVKVPSDTATLVIQYVGYQKTEVYLNPQLPKRNLLIEVKPSSQMLNTVVVEGQREDIVLSNKEDISTIKMTPKKLEQLPNIGEKDIMRSFQLMPGIGASNESSSGLYVRGGTPDQNLILYDGFTIYYVDHLYGFFSAFNSNALKDIQLYKGAFESRFGGRLSSVTEIAGKEGNQKKFNMGGDFSLLSANAFVEIPIGKKFTSVVAFRRSYQGYVYDKIFNKFNSSQTTTSDQPSGGGRFKQQSKAVSFFYDLNAKLTYRPTDKDIISFSLFNGTDKLNNGTAAASSANAPSSFSTSSTDLTKYGNIGSSLKWSRKWSSKLYGNTILSYSNYYSDRDRSQERTVTNAAGTAVTTKTGLFENNNLKDYSFKSDYEWNIFKNSQLQFGGFATYFDIKYTYAQNDTNTILDRHNFAVLAGGYVQSKTKFFDDKLIFLPGIRISYFDVTGKPYYEPRASAIYKLTSKISLKAATGKYYQFANRVTREDILSGSRDFWVLSDGNKIPVSSAIHYVAGISYETNDYLFSAEGYYKKLSGLTEYSLRFNASPEGVDYNENFFNGTGYSRGIEFLAQKKFGKFNGWVSYTLAEAMNHFAIYSTDDYPASQDVTHEFKIVGLYKYKRWDFSATWIFATGRPYTAPSGAYTITLLDGTTQDYFTVTAKNSLRLPDYHRADISVNYKLLVGEKRRDIGYIGFSIFNVYNRTNVWYKQYSIVDGQIIETNVNYLGITPNLTLSLKLR
ncbi:MAG: outer rane receptor protein [Bacteroidetes bacterium]|nr:outer rane receptor protein [Bacteroidota bacterium]